jgi:3',5'-cyclic AMP phosphodiesterase CpdA
LQADLNAMELDQILVSGDLTNLSLPAELALARSWLDGLTLGPKNVTVVPGNHDIYTRSAAGRDTFGHYLAPFIEGDRTGSSSAAFPFVRRRGAVTLIGVSTAHPSAPFLAVGTVGDTQLRRLEELLARSASEGAFRIVVIHHAPHSARVRWSNRLVDSDKFAEVIARAGAELIVHGHLHRTCHDELKGPAGPVPVIGVCSSTWLNPRDSERTARYHVYRVQGGQLAGLETRRFDPLCGRFA